MGTCTGLVLCGGGGVWWWACECKRETAALGKSGLVLCGALSVGIGIGIGTLGAGLAPPPVNFFSGTPHSSGREVPVPGHVEVSTGGTAVDLWQGTTL